MTAKEKLRILKELLTELNFNDKLGKGTMIGLYEPPPVTLEPVDLEFALIVQIINKEPVTCQS
ncbi:MAG: hypothetical protein ACFFD4_05205 [Candidatus Odinarchaeota archaeon]